MARRLREMGLEVRLQRVGDRFNVLGRLPVGTGRGPTVMLNGHLDTLPLPPGWRTAPYRLRVRRDELIGAEVNNMKAALAAYLEAIRRLRRAPRGASGAVLLAAVVSECDALGLGTRALLDAGIRADWAIVGEPTALTVLTAHGGVMQVRVVVEGRSAHVSQRASGRNAVEAMVRMLSGLDESVLRYRPHPSFPGLPTLNIGVLRGGTLPSMLAERCEALIDVRTVPGMTPHSVRRDLLRHLRPAAHRARVRVEVVLSEPPVFCQQYPFLVPATSPVVRAVVAAHRHVIGCTPRVGAWQPLVFYGTDGSHLARAGIPVAIYGPGTTAQVNRPEESMALSDVLAAAEVYHLALRGLLGGDPPEAG
ncbi:MAG: M20/M25/M40 family metallo-hydrolase [Armatimonadota bacterium]|nr:M20/M25/M40 family metallo-hydrolase [Armatimonadota bacterium]